MKKIYLVTIIFLILFALLIAACAPSGQSTDLSDIHIAETMLAIAITQTSMAQIQPPATITQEPLPPTPMPTDPQIDLPAEGPPADEEQTTALTEIVHQVTPGNPGWIHKWFYDTDSSKNAGNKSVTAGDDFTANLYERPFTEGEMVYRPDIDINKTEISEDNNFYYVTIYPNNTHPVGGFQAAYAIEIDEDWDGRGDLLVIADRPSSNQWDITGLSVWRDANKNVGGQTILRPDTGYSGDSYEQELFSINVLNDPDVAWARVSEGSPASVTIAFKKSLLTRSTFVWGVWAADSLLDPALFDHHDHFTKEEAGSPNKSHTTYPLKALNLIDNTCRETYNFEATTPFRGLCYSREVPMPTPETPNTPGVPTPETPNTPQPQFGYIEGIAFQDFNNNGKRDAGEPPVVYYDVKITLLKDSCFGTTVTSTTAKEFSFGPLAPGTYCVTIDPPFPMTTPSFYLFSLGANETIYLEFGYETLI
ncbi:MAG: SdrD B-like domain-containing protein [Brevefilum fermentans]